MFYGKYKRHTCILFTYKIIAHLKLQTSCHQIFIIFSEEFFGFAFRSPQESLYAEGYVVLVLNSGLPHKPTYQACAPAC